MNKLFWALVPPCITFGPLFMTRLAGKAGPQAGDGFVLGGVIMLAVGLTAMFRMIIHQQKLIEKLAAGAARGT